MDQGSDHRKNQERPIVAVGAIIFYGDKILLAKRANEPRKDQWSLPGGTQKLGETSRDAIKREIKEETDLSFDPSGLVDSIDIIQKSANGMIEYHYTVIDYWGIASNDRVRAASDVSALEWVHYNALANYELNEEALKMIEKAKTLRARNDKHSVQGHGKMILIAALFGLTAYAVLYVFMQIFRALGIQSF